jgi:hypothetical protein
MFTSFRHFFASPVFENENNTRTAYVLNTVSLLILCALFLAFILSPIIASATGGQTNYNDALSQILSRGGVLILISFATLVLLRVGYIRHASIFFVAAAWVLVAINVYRTGGTESPAFLNFLVAIIIAGLLLGSKATILTAVLSFGVGIGVLYMNNINRLPAYEPLTPTGTLILGGISFSIATLVLTLYVRRLNETVNQLRNANLQLDIVGKELEKRVVDRTRSLETAFEVSQQLSAILDPDQLVLEVVERIRAAYD